MKVLSEFKSFAFRSNVMDLAVGVVIGAGFGKIVSSLVSDIIMPPIGLLIGGVDFSKLAIALKEPAGEVPGVYLRYGLFLNTILDFVIIAFSIYLFVKVITMLKVPSAAIGAKTKDCPQCAMSVPLSAKRCGHCTSVFS